MNVHRSSKRRTRKDNQSRRRKIGGDFGSQNFNRVYRKAKKTSWKGRLSRWLSKFFKKSTLKEAEEEKRYIAKMSKTTVPVTWGRKAYVTNLDYLDSIPLGGQEIVRRMLEHTCKAMGLDWKTATATERDKIKKLTLRSMETLPIK